MVDLHECEELSICCGAERNEYVEDFCGQCNESTTFECIDCGKPEDTKNIVILNNRK